MTNLLVDVRTPSEYSEGCKNGAINIPLENIVLGDFGIISTLPKDTKIDCYCRSGGRAEMAKNILNSSGYTKVLNAGGL